MAKPLLAERDAVDSLRGLGKNLKIYIP